MNELDRTLLTEIQKGIPLTTEPFNEIATKLKITPDEVIARIAELQENGVIRRFGASLKPNNLGLSANALVAWKVSENRIEEVGAYFAKFKEVTHCYQRKTVAGKWEYNLYTVMHAQQRQTIDQLASSFSKTIEVNDFIILYSIRDLKRSSISETSNEPSSKAFANLAGNPGDEEK